MTPRPTGTRRAAAQFAWAGPLRPLRKRYRRLASASLRLGSLAIAAAIVLPIARASEGFGPAWIALSIGLVVFGCAGLLLGRSASGEAARIDEEIARIEEEAERQLP